MRSSLRRSLWLILLCSIPSPEAKAMETLTVAAAASLREALDAIQPSLPADISWNVTYGASGALQQQIAQGAPIDVFLSAAEKPLAELDAQGFLLKGTRRPLLGNRLVLITRKGLDVRDIADLKKADIKRLALGEPRTVPAGDYAMQALAHYSLATQLQPKFIYAKDVKQVLTYVTRGEVDAGFVYKSDLSGAKNDVNSVDIDAKSHQAIRYAVAVVKSSKKAAAAARLLDFLGRERAAAIWRKYGFRVLPPVKDDHGGR